MIRTILKSTLAAALVAGSLLSTSAAYASDSSKGWVGGLFGLTVPSYNGTQARGMYGLTAGAKVGTEFGVGVYYLSSQKRESIGDFNFDLYGVQVGYHFEGEANGVFIAGRIGTSKIAVNGTTNASPMNYGAVVGYDYMLVEHVSLGGEVSFMSIASAASTESFTALNFLAALKLWF